MPAMVAPEPPDAARTKSPGGTALGKQPVPGKARFCCVWFGLLASLAVALGQESLSSPLFSSGPLVAYAASIAMTPYSDLCRFESLEGRSEAGVNSRDDFLIPKSAVAALFEHHIETSMSLEPSIALVAKNPGKRGEPDWRPRVCAGYGGIFEDDVIGYSRTSGAGHRDRDMLYFKLTLTF